MRTYLHHVRGFGRDIKLFLLYSFLANIGFGVSQLIFNLYLYALNLREDFIGAFNAVQTLSMAGTAMALGFLLNRFGTWRCITGGVCIFLAASFSLALAEWPPLLLVLAGFSGVGLAFLFTATMPFIIEWAKPEQRPEVAALSFSLISLAATLGALIGGFVPAWLSAAVPSIERGSPEAFRATLIAGTLVGTFGLLPLFSMGDARARRRAAEHLAAPAGEPAAVRRRAKTDKIVFVLIGGLMSLGAGMVMPFYNVFLTTLGASARQVGYVYALGGLSAAVIGLMAPAVARRMGSLRAVVMLRLVVVPFYALLIVWPVYGVAVLAHLARQTSISMAWPIDSTFIAEVLPARDRASVFGWRSAAWNLGFSAASFTGGIVIVRSGYAWTFVSLIVFSTLAASSFITYFGRHPLIRSGDIPSALPRPSRRKAVGGTP